MSDRDQGENSDIQSLFRPNIALMSGYEPGQQPKSGGYIKLNTNENPYPPSPKVLDAIRDLLGEDGASLRRYPNPVAQQLRKAAAEKFDFPVDGIMAGNGSDELLTIIARAFAGPRPKGSILTPYPTYTLYKTLAEIENSNFQTVDFPNDYSIPDGLGMMKARLVFLANPNSPTGTLVAPSAVRELAQKVSGVLVIDEAYADFADLNCLDIAREMRNVIVLRSFSKSYSLAGMRVGLAFAHPEIIRGMMKIKDSYNLNQIAIVAATAALKDSAYFLENRRKVLQTRERLASALVDLGWDIFPSHANFVFVRVPEPDGLENRGASDEDPNPPPRAKIIYERLSQQKILVRYFDARRLNDCLRISVGTDDEIDTLINTLEEILSELKIEDDMKRRELARQQQDAAEEDMDTRNG